MSGPLEGVRVVEAAQYVAGPLAGALLRELGADVVKVEPPAGDGYRHVLPLAPGLGRYFVPLNRGKRSVVLDLETGAGRDRLRGLLGTADVLLHNYPPVRAQRFGVGWDDLHAAIPGLVVGVVTSFGASGPLAGTPAYDLVAQARAGLLTAHASTGDDVPVRAGGIPIADLAAGMLLATSAAAALVRARATGVGERVESSLLGAALAVQVQDLVWQGDEASTGQPGATPADLAARAGEIADGLELDPYYRCYRTADGFAAVACLNAVQRRAFLEALGLDDPGVDMPDVLPGDEAVSRRRALTAAAAAAFAAEPLAVWSERLGAAGVPCGPVNARERVGLDLQVAAAGLLVGLDQPGVGPLTLLGGLLGGSGDAAPAPALGADTEAVLAEAAT